MRLGRAISHRGGEGGSTGAVGGHAIQPSNASEPKTRLTTGSRMDSKRSIGRRMHCHKNHTAYTARLSPGASFVSTRALVLIAFKTFRRSLRADIHS